MSVVEAVWAVAKVLITIVLIIVVCFLGALAAVAAATAAIAAFPLAWFISLLWGVAFIDALAWTWSLLSLLVLLGLLAASSRR
ncbi:hypothetical protein FFT09_14825 [Saccharomonospora piscinae]|uniref:hypothetical protein n=1 Tax=Saccharomonospora piscinae TaxID=687388 RepID=UPI001106F1D5|nr:hypothetical protein [Saccharomonospora piscinae]TLW92142.1 hypothetical protein FFT09_14825 [Saccharomonospora piscinae]